MTRSLANEMLAELASTIKGLLMRGRGRLRETSSLAKHRDVWPKYKYFGLKNHFAYRTRPLQRCRRRYSILKGNSERSKSNYVTCWYAEGKFQNLFSDSNASEQQTNWKRSVVAKTIAMIVIMILTNGSARRIK